MVRVIGAGSWIAIAVLTLVAGACARTTVRPAWIELIRQRGLPTLLDYFRAFAESDDRFGNFRRAFGLSVEEFEVKALIRVRAELTRVVTDVRSPEESPPDHPTR